MVAPESRIVVEDTEGFDPLDWMKKEVLWASLMTPYGQQMNKWLNDYAFAQHAGNETRRNVYGENQSIEGQSLAYFNHGKTIAGLISSTILFRALMPKSIPGAHINLLRMQAEAVGRIMGRLSQEFSGDIPSDDEVHDQCSELVNRASADHFDGFRASRLLFKASNIMSGLAAAESAAWLAKSVQNEDRTLPVLTIPDGGHPRSRGNRVDKLQPIFHKIVQSEAFRSI